MLGYELILKRGNDLKTETCHWFTLVIVLYENGISTLKRQLYKLVKHTQTIRWGWRLKSELVSDHRFQLRLSKYWKNLTKFHKPFPWKLFNLQELQSIETWHYPTCCSIETNAESNFPWIIHADTSKNKVIITGKWWM